MNIDLSPYFAPLDFPYSFSSWVNSYPVYGVAIADLARACAVGQGVVPVLASSLMPDQFQYLPFFPTSFIPQKVASFDVDRRPPQPCVHASRPLTQIGVLMRYDWAMALAAASVEPTLATSLPTLPDSSMRLGEVTSETLSSRRLGRVSFVDEGLASWLFVLDNVYCGRASL